MTELRQWCFAGQERRHYWLIECCVGSVRNRLGELGEVGALAFGRFRLANCFQLLGRYC